MPVRYGAVDSLINQHRPNGSGGEKTGTIPFIEKIKTQSLLELVRRELNARDAHQSLSAKHPNVIDPLRSNPRLKRSRNLAALPSEMTFVVRITILKSNQFITNQRPCPNTRHKTWVSLQANYNPSVPARNIQGGAHAGVASGKPVSAEHSGRLRRTEKKVEANGRAPHKKPMNRLRDRQREGKAVTAPPSTIRVANRT